MLFVSCICYDKAQVQNAKDYLEENELGVKICCMWIARSAFKIERRLHTYPKLYVYFSSYFGLLSEIFEAVAFSLNP